MKNRTRERAEKALLDAARLNDDKAAASLNKISLRSLQRFRQARATDPKLAAADAKNQAELAKKNRDEVAQELAATFRAVLDYIRRAADEADPKDPKAIEALTAALAKVQEVSTERAVVDARLTRTNRPAGSEARPVAAGATAATGDSGHGCDTGPASPVH